MTASSVSATPVRTARIAGALFLATIVLGVLAQGVISERLIARGDAAATAAGVLAHRGLFQAGLAIYLVEMACQVAMTVFFYRLLKPVSRELSLTAMALGLVGCTIKTTSRLFYLAILLVAAGPAYLDVFEPAQRSALAQLFFQLNDRGAAIALVFFGFSDLLVGALIIRSTFLPRILGVLGMAGAAGWLTYLYQPLGDRAFPIVALVALVGAVALIGWLLVVGVHEARWRELAARAA